MKHRLIKYLAMLSAVIVIFGFSIAFTRAEETNTPVSDTTVQEVTTVQTDTTQEATEQETDDQSTAAKQTQTATDQDASTQQDQSQKAAVQPKKSSSAQLSAASSGSRDVSSTAVDSITINDSTEDSEIYAGEDFFVEVAFSEKDKGNFNFQSGDTIKINWDAPDGVTWTGYTGTIELHQDNEDNKPIMATAVVNETNVIITFNENVNSMQQVNGSVYFTIRNEGTPTTDENNTGKIYTSDMSKSVAIKRYTGPTFTSKGGNPVEGTNTIEWTIQINNTSLTNLTGSITITDELPSTETFNESQGIVAGLFIKNAQNAQGETKTVYTGFPENDFNFSYQLNGKKIIITIPEGYVSKLNNYSYTDSEGYSYTGPIGVFFTFYTTSEATAGKTVTNNITTSYQVSGETEKTEEQTGTATIPSSGGSITGAPQGTIWVHKVVNGTTDPIEGVHFRVYKVTDETGNTVQTGWYNNQDYVEIVSDSTGLASLANLDDGYYKIVEISDQLPNWIASSSLKTIVVQLGGTAGTETTIENDVKTTDITATKNWTQSDGQTADTSDHPTVYFKLFRSVNNGTAEAVDAEIKAVQTLSGQSTASVTWEDLPQYDNQGNLYTYSVIEVDASGNDFTPDGYTKTEDGLIVTNMAKTGEREEKDSLTIIKVDENGNEIDGAEFTLYDGNQAVLTFNGGTYVLTTDELKALLGDADQKTFTLKETKAPNGYQLSTKEYQITLSKTTAQEWEGEGADRAYVTITTYKLTCGDAEDNVLQVVNTPDVPAEEKPKTPESPKAKQSGVPTGTNSNSLLWMFTMCAAAAAAVILLKNRKHGTDIH